MYNPIRSASGNVGGVCVCVMFINQLNNFKNALKTTCNKKKKKKMLSFMYENFQLQLFLKMRGKF